MLKIGIWKLNGYIGGTETSLVELAKYLAGLGYEVKCYGKTGMLGGFAETMGVQILEEHKFDSETDVLLLYDSNYDVRGGATAEERLAITNKMVQLTQAKRIIAVLGGYVHALICPYAQGALVKSRSIAHWLRQNSKYRHIKVSQFPIDLDYWKRGNRRHILRDKWGVSDSEPVIGYVGNTNPGKRVIKTLDAILDCDAKAALAISGKVVNEKALKRPGNRVFIEHGLNEMREFYEAVDAVVLLSAIEGVPRSLMEAMAMELPVVTYDVGGICELTPRYFCAPGTKVEMTNCLSSLVNNKKLRKEAGRENLGRIRLFNEYVKADLKAYFEGGYLEETERIIEKKPEPAVEPERVIEKPKPVAEPEAPIQNLPNEEIKTRRAPEVTMWMPPGASRAIKINQWAEPEQRDWTPTQKKPFIVRPKQVGKKIIYQYLYR